MANDHTETPEVGGTVPERCYQPECDCCKVADAQLARIAELEAVVRKYHDWHMDLDEDVEGYLDSSLFEAACGAMPLLRET